MSPDIQRHPYLMDPPKKTLAPVRPSASFLSYGPRFAMPLLVLMILSVEHSGKRPANKDRYLEALSLLSIP